jgi:hypothetical protein
MVIHNNYADFLQWEYAHAVNAVIKILGLSLLVLSVIIETPKKKVVHSQKFQ